ncbi:LSU ribosomal protein L4P [Dethiosulfatibacter aminovorans DSM 17477]|uniref:Large ribosomal subunit protein uL4 n=1 Tax=Dethiosulfatibacter aminovorans DSM 17477 TaxID=1121476 RepID=A0A1M6L4J5_9FIRM|nr:50S ribosomal protein L4 [Dethiosulfatibacter aminovorans]SHJ66155.1 LSU ribosomal protein L4P [Dethiosulfatibacter aminovorans DSM 17477]
MPKVALYNVSGEQVGDIELKDDVFGIEINTHVMYEAVKVYLANQRQGTQSAKTRSEVRGGGRKPWRQKGTGRARQGSIRSPQWKGGGVIFAPKPRDYSMKLPKKIRRLALKSAFSAKVEANEIIVLDALTMEAPKTKEMLKVLGNLKVEKKALVVTPDKDENVVLSARNIPGVKTAQVGTLNVYDILNHDAFIITKDAVNKVEEVYS